MEGSAGSTAISFATIAPAYGCKCHVVIPDDAAIEKVLSLSPPPPHPPLPVFFGSNPLRARNNIVLIIDRNRKNGIYGSSITREVLVRSRVLT